MMNEHDPASRDDELRELAANGGIAPYDDALDALLAADADAWRATLPAEERFAGRMVGVLRGADDPESTSQSSVAVVDDEQGDVTFTREPLDEPPGDRRRPILPRRLARGRGRGLLAVGAMAAVVAVLVVVIQVLAPLRAGYLPTTPTQVVTGKPPVTLAGGAWQQIGLPLTGQRWFSYAASPDDPTTIYACFSAGLTANGPELARSPLSAWVTHDTGTHWHTLPLPKLMGTNCELRVVAGQPGRVALLVHDVTPDQRYCVADTIYLSVDAGGHWAKIPIPNDIPRGSVATYCTFYLSADALYFLSGYAQTAGAPNHISFWRLQDGAGWTSATNSLGAGTGAPQQVGAGDTFVVAHMADSGDGSKPAASWITRDGGRHWQRMGQVADGRGVFVGWSSSVSAVTPTTALPLYALEGSGPPAEYFYLRAYQTSNGLSWAELPPLPVPHASTDHTGLTNPLGEDAAGRFYAFGVGVAGGVPTQSPQRNALSPEWLWVWDPHVPRWERFPTPLMASWAGCASMCWYPQLTANPAGGTYLWVASNVFYPSDNASDALYRVLVR